MKNRRLNWKLVTAFVLTLALAAGMMGASTLPLQAAVPKLDKIRVGLFMEHGTYRSPEQAVTLASEEGFNLGVRTPAAVTNWAVEGSPQMRVSLDGYGVRVLETAQYKEAKAAYDKLQSSPSDRAYIISRTKGAAAAYSVYYGSYAAKETAAAALNKAVKLTGSAQAVLSGPLHWSAGTFASQAEAAKQAAQLGQSGVDADVVLTQGAGGQAAYHVWVGAEADEAALAAVKAKLPGASLAPVDPAQPYLIQRSDVSLNQTAIPHYAAGAGAQKTWIESRGSSIGVKERSDRVYRGSMEVSRYNGKFALINELPFEHYLYSVVSSEMDGNFPLEALKAQAVAARTYAIKQGMKYGIAHLSDSTTDQSYKGMQREVKIVQQAVDATQGEVLVNDKGLISEPLYSSNSGGKTADATEIWGNAVPYLKSVDSPDTGAAAGKADWYRISLGSGKTGYVSGVYLKKTGEKNEAGLEIAASTQAGVNVRPLPSTDNASSPSFAQLKDKERVTLLEKVTESNSYSWFRMYDRTELEKFLASAGVKLDGPLRSLEVSKRGPSGRAIELKANGSVVKVKYPNDLRNVLGGLPSTLFEIEESGRYTIEGADGATQSLTAGSGSVQVLAAGQTKPQNAGTELFVMGADNQVRSVTSDTRYIIRGTGNGHGLGMSQWGARGLADQGKTYTEILQTYYSGVWTTKE
ncbi:SpoIID/LytB domain-containing protein [Paenibacillus lutrae]|uniref:SpoIID/LytB domain-containing protein n=1 Tax=Paenibacillus lutrae TaxID=2078573 RepID=A0A7X3FH51_9BACL|nr:SpoIID/LytB domain-containing protein [Paenibacillus lutrae]MVO99653.1 SpoIID/LytB domain-containing protein [Paenibacillus lutrae]